MPSAFPIDLAQLLAPVQAIAWEAGRRILAVYGSPFSVTAKSDHSPVTEADLAAHRYIVEQLAALTPHIPIISEEAPAVDFQERRQWEWLWLVDPLDGTREFIRHSDQFSVNIALIHRQAPVLGLISLPVVGICYRAYRGGGAYKHLAGARPRRIRATPERAAPLRVVVSDKAYGSPRVQAYLHRLGAHRCFCIGGALKSCLVAEGEADLYPRFGPTGEWDTAAAQIICEEAGAHLTDTALQPLKYNTRPTLTNPDFLVFGDSHYDWARHVPLVPSKGSQKQFTS